MHPETPPGCGIEPGATTALSGTELRGASLALRYHQYEEVVVKIILTESIPSLGQIGDIVNVAPGYARNYLFPKRLAMEAIEKNVRDLEHKKKILAEKR